MDVLIPTAPCQQSRAKEYYVSVDSADRDRTTWPLSSRFEVKFGALPEFQGANVGRAFKNVRSVELVNCVYPNTANVLQQPCLYLSFDELPGRYDGTNVTSTGAFAKLLHNVVQGGFVISSGDSGNDGHPQRKVAYTPGVRIDRLTPTLRTVDGTVFNFGSDGGVSANLALQTSYTLRITVEEPYVV